MPRLRASGLFLLSVFIFILWRHPSAPAWAQPRQVPEHVYTQLSLSYQYMKSGKTDAARAQLEQVLRTDPHNPYALNNLAVISEQRGRLKEAMAYLLAAETSAVEYTEKTADLCQVGGLCTALKPSHDRVNRSSIAAVVHDNINLLKVKIGQKEAQEKR
jgi:Flp pilus assembly protein TadD